MGTDELLTRACRAIETGQPNLAQLYMRKALEQTEQHRREMNPYRKLNQHLAAFTEAVQGFAEIYLEGLMSAAKIVMDAIAPAINTLAEASTAADQDGQKSDYTLVAPCTGQGGAS